ncbi:uncharacterized protein LOC110727774 isoform X1 [Chenopodium quinoa]|uniref:PGG domain-containing protein n=1 Tax=Chenopodium quinoa TaxID=63459 RepID=A0A803L2B0_CHEQI|nr:uncharacterized protein LOC110727774 isoform X1 [Chenopodium quinoa]
MAFSTEPEQINVEIELLGRRCFQDYHVRLYKAAFHGDWKSAHEIFVKDPKCFSEIISKNGNTALHIAAAAGKHKFVEELLAHANLTDTQLVQPNKAGNTAFCLAAASGVVDLVKEMEKHNSNLPNIGGNLGKKPIQMAAMQGHEKVVDHLMTYFTNLSPEDRINLLITVIEKDLYDVALKILNEDDELAIKRDGNAVSPLLALARKTPVMSKLSYLEYICNALKNKWGKQEKDHNGKHELVQQVWKRVIRERDHESISSFLWFPSPGLLFEAIEVGNNEFIETLVREYPDLIWEVDKQQKTIFHVAVEYRQEKIFSHIFHLKDVNHLLTEYVHPITGNNILHLAASLPRPEILNKVSGAALQMQRELLWFQAVKSIVPYQFAHTKNRIIKKSNGIVTDVIEETPGEMYTRVHTNLRKEGEEWMRGTANSCMLVATLVSAMVFQAVFQSPGTHNNNLKCAFVISDALSLLSSTASILTFLAILCSTYAEEDFLVSLPLKLIVGLATLLFSILTMLLAFTMAIITQSPNRSGWIIVAAFAWIVGGVYVWLHFPLLVMVCRSTFGAKYLFRPQYELLRD